ncbi:uncharacterized protein E0L32_005329 [Thyridium curvatum]|uniref:NmrA-like domain-containing protein n=1 Tax=Thyridium curvatum TaxID=1093900 RepID=A0A507B4G8_9PEZI|nr:uncharacterized protein E0L32_005329 [Thyridium curvatum]TPX14637.1 hypothetical protein E0L32_005329 [Thyridium curvatum]
MVRIAVAGGSGQVAREVIDALVATGKHEITVLSRRDLQSADATDPGVKQRTVNYGNVHNLTEALQGVHTLLSFVQILSDPNQESQKNLIDAAIASGVRRFAPSEYGSKGTNHMAWWAGKEAIREYLEEVNATEKKLEYTLFQPGLFLDYLAFPYKTAKYLDPLQSVFDFEHRRAIVVDGHEDAILTLTTVSDLSEIIARAVEYEGAWPRHGGIRGNRLTFSDILRIGETVRGHFDVDKVYLEDLRAGNLKTSWGLEAVHHAVSDDQAAELLRAVSIGILLSSVEGAWDSSDSMSRLFPDFKFTTAHDFLVRAWDGKP